MHIGQLPIHYFELPTRANPISKASWDENLDSKKRCLCEKDHRLRVGGKDKSEQINFIQLNQCG